MRRLHLFEVTERAECPAFLRHFATRFLRTAQRLGLYPRYRAAVPLLAAAIRKSGASAIVDLAGGSGGPLLDLAGELRAEVGAPLPITVTDAFPDPKLVIDEADVRVETAPVDARDVPARLPGLRTMFTAFHHFRPDEAREVLADAARSGAPIAVFEIGERTVPGLLINLLVPLTVWIAAPFVRPVHWGSLVLTYLIPVTPLVLAWDAFVSCARCYSPSELTEIAHSVPSTGYEWEAGQLPTRGGRITYLIGTPVAEGRS